MFDRISNYMRSWNFLLPVLGLIFIKLSSVEQKWKWYLGNLTVSAILFLTILQDCGRNIN